MKKTFKTVNYEQALDLTVRLGDCLPPVWITHLITSLFTRHRNLTSKQYFN
jgi:hypothetical protein